MGILKNGTHASKPNVESDNEKPKSEEKAVKAESVPQDESPKETRNGGYRGKVGSNKF